jgi:hypothetical protein
VYELNYTLPSDAAVGVWLIFLVALKGEHVRKHSLVFEVQEVPG